MSLILAHWKTIAIAVLVVVSITLFKSRQDLKKELSDKNVTIKSMSKGIEQYKAKDGTFNERLINERRRAKDIEESKDSVIQKITAQLKNSNIKLTNALALGYMKTTIVVDTTIVYVTPTRPKVNLDGTTLAALDTLLDFSKRPHIINTVKLTDSTATNKLSITNELFLNTNARRETVDAPKKFFLWRWFQKKHWLIYTDIKNSNPYIKTENAKFITIVDDDGDTKTEDAK